MKNIFVGQQDKRVPKTLNDCIKPDGVSTALWKWAERTENWGFAIFVLTLIAGAIATIIVGITTYDAANVTVYGRPSNPFAEAFGAMLITAASTVLGAFIEYCIYHAFALLLGALASIVQNTAISANLAIYSATGKKGDKFVENAEPPKKHEESKFKKKIIDAAVDILGPGEVDSKPEKKETKVISVKGSSRKICLGCGEVVSADTARCECGCNSFTTEDITVEREVPFTPTSSRMPSTEYNYDIPVDNGDEEYIDCSCPSCGKDLSFRKGVKQVVCPWCDSEFSI